MYFKFNTNRISKYRQNPIPPCNGFNSIFGQRTDNLAKPVNNLLQGLKNFIIKPDLPYLLPDLLNRIHLRRVGRDKNNLNIFRNF